MEFRSVTYLDTRPVGLHLCGRLGRSMEGKTTSLPLWEMPWLSVLVVRALYSHVHSRLYTIWGPVFYFLNQCPYIIAPEHWSFQCIRSRLLHSLLNCLLTLQLWSCSSTGHWADFLMPQFCMLETLVHKVINSVNMCGIASCQAWGIYGCVFTELHVWRWRWAIYRRIVFPWKCLCLVNM